MKLKRQPARPRGGGGSGRAARRPPARPSRFGRGRQARRPGKPLRRRVGARLPSLRRLIAGVGAIATAAVLVALLNGPWLRITDVAWAGGQYTPSAQLREALEPGRGESLLGVDTAALRERLEALPSVASASVSAGIGGRLEATVEEPEAAFVWITRSSRLLGAADGTIFARGARGGDIDAGLEHLPRVVDERFAGHLLDVGEAIPEALLRTALRIGTLDPARLGSDASDLTVRLDEEYGFRLVADVGWEAALGVFGLDPRESAAEADERLDRQVAAVRTLFAERDEASVGWVDVRNPGKVYFRAKG